MTTATLTPTTNTAPAVASIVDELSGAIWASRFPGSRSTSTLTTDFKASCDAFIAAIAAAGGNKHISATFRPFERAYLMHWAHKICRNDFPPENVPAKNGVHINWVHPTAAASKAAAQDLCDAFQISGLAADTAPSLNTLHSTGQAIDISINWTGTLNIANKDGTVIAIASEPRTGMNAELKAVGLTYGVVKFVGGAADRPHWSTTGH